ncbi:MAG: hypothetical protein CL768_00785 [Chloroflexi bacterium]|nr:hypothetical protein [Chloroflexota bacterium]
MNSTTLAGWFLIIGPILILASFAGWPTDAENYQEELIDLAKNPSMSILIMTGFFIGITLLFTGLTVTSRLISEGNTRLSSLAVPSGILFPLCIAITMASVGLNFGAVRLYETSIENATTIYLISYHITDVIGLAMGISFILLGAGLIDKYKDLFRRVIGLLYSIIGICHLIGVFITSTDLGPISWLGMFFVSIVFGVDVLRGQSQ